MARAVVLLLMIGGSVLLCSDARGAIEMVSDGLQAHWKFDESMGLTASDASGNGNDGELLEFKGEEVQWADGVVNGA